jgi:hypothetical protein
LPKATTVAACITYKEDKIDGLRFAAGRANFFGAEKNNVKALLLYSKEQKKKKINYST